MTIVCHSRKFIFLRTKKTAGTSMEVWLAQYLDPSVDLIKLDTGHDKLHPELWKKFNNLSAQIKLTAKSMAKLSPAFRAHMPASEVRSFVGEKTWRGYRKIVVVRNPWDRVISAWRWSDHSKGSSRTLSAFVANLEEAKKEASATGWRRKRIRRIARIDNWPYYAIDDEIVADDVLRFETLVADARRSFDRVGISDCVLPREKSGIRKVSDRVDLLTPELIDRIGALYRREIDAFSYAPPAAVGSGAGPTEMPRARSLSIS